MTTQEDEIKKRIYEDFQVKYFSSRDDGKTKFVQLNTEEQKEFCFLQRRDVEEEYQRIKYGLVAIAGSVGKDIADQAYKLFISGKNLREVNIKHSLKSLYLEILRKFGLENLVNV